jgi:hypothetical protein
MKIISNLKTISVIAALALTAGMPLASHAQADARSVNSFNEGSEPPFLQSAPQATEQKASTLVKTKDAVKMVGEPKTTTNGYWTLLDAEVNYRKTREEDAKAMNKVNEGQLPSGQ